MALNERMYEILHELENEYGKNGWTNTVDESDPRLVELREIAIGDGKSINLKKDDVLRMRAAIESGFPTLAELANKFNCSQSLIDSFIQNNNELRWAWKEKNRNKIKTVLIKDNQATIFDNRQRVAEKLGANVNTVSYRMRKGLSIGGYDIVSYPDYLKMKGKSKVKVIKKTIVRKPKVRVKKSKADTHLLREKKIFKR